MRDLPHQGLAELILRLDFVHEDPIIPVHADQGVDEIIRLIGDLELHFEVDRFVMIVEKLRLNYVLSLLPTLV